MRALKIEQAITSRDEQSLNRYLGELDSLELISAEEEIRLAKKIRGGDTHAMEKLIRSNLRFVVSCAKKYQGLGLPLADLVSEGNMGLIRAAQLFDETKGFKFISYAVWWIRQGMIAALGNDTRMIRLPGNMVRSTAEIRRCSDLLEQQLERRPTPEEILELAEVSQGKVSIAYAFGRTVGSLDSPVSPESELSLWEMLEDEKAVVPDSGLLAESAAQEVQSLLQLLDGREQWLLAESFGLSGRAKSCAELSMEMGLTGERVRQLRSEAIEKIRRKLQQKGIKVGDAVKRRGNGPA